MSSYRSEASGSVAVSVICGFNVDSIDACHSSVYLESLALLLNLLLQGQVGGPAYSGA